MEEIIDFDTFIANYIPKSPEYEAIYNEEGIIISICPKGVSDQIVNKVPIDLEIVEQIHAGQLQLHNCFIDLDSGSIEITRQEYLKKIDDIFHRIPEKKFVDGSISNDIEIFYLKKTKQINFMMSKKLKEKKIRWSGDTVLCFYCTAYNDPHLMLEKIEITIDELYKSDKILQVELPEKFSIFTRRLLKNYVMEIR